MTKEVSSSSLGKGLGLASQFWRNFIPTDQRSAKAFKNVLVSFSCKALRICVGFLLVPLSIDYLNPTRYGLWLTIFSIVMWIGFSDVGLGNGLRNHLTSALAVGDTRLARIYVSTTYFAVSLMLAIALVVFLVVNSFINWGKLLNAPVSLWSEVNRTVILVFSLICLYFILQLIIRVCQANQEPAYREVADLISGVFLLGAIFLLCKAHGSASLLIYATLVTGIPVMTLIGFHLILFAGRYRDIAPSPKFVSLAHLKDIANLGLNFFLIQIAGVILFSTDNFLIAYLIGPAEVTRVSIPTRYFRIVMTGFALIVSPLWSAVTDAYQRGEMAWVKRVVRKLVRIWAITALGCVVMLAFSQYFYHFWIGNRVAVENSISIVVAALTITRTLGAIFTNVINGFGTLRVQTINGVLAAAVNIPLSVVLARHLHMGSIGVLLATLMLSLAGISLRAVQYRRIVNDQAEGIWAR